MISWLKGHIIHNWQIASKKGIILNVGGVGYEIQLLERQIVETINAKEIEFWIHQVEREDCTSLYGFIEINQRDLFRKIIAVNGIGPQIGLSLLEDFDVPQLVNAIESNDLIALTKAQGIGKRIAERLVVELKNKLQQFTVNKDINIRHHTIKESNQFDTYKNEIKSILNSLGYLDNEIKDSIEIITTEEKEKFAGMNSLSEQEKSALLDDHLKQILLRLSQNST